METIISQAHRITLYLIEVGMHIVACPCLQQTMDFQNFLETYAQISFCKFSK